MYYYSAYCLGVVSSIPLPGYLETDECRADIKITRIFSANPSGGPLSKVVAEKTATGGFLFKCPYGGLEYEVLGGREITIIFRENSSVELERLALHGFALAAILHQRGFLILHASSVEISGRAVVFLGEKTHGKSTLVAHLVAEGHRLLSDDVTALLVGSDRISVLPGMPCIKLWPDSMLSIGLNPEDYPRVYSAASKRNYFVPGRFCNEERELDTVFMLNSHQDRIDLFDLNGIDKMLWLTGGCYLSRFQDVLSPVEREKMFKDCSLLTKKTRIIRLDRPRELKFLGKTGQLVEEYLLRR